MNVFVQSYVAATNRRVAANARLERFRVTKAVMNFTVALREAIDPAELVEEAREGFIARDGMLKYLNRESHGFGDIELGVEVLALKISSKQGVRRLCLFW